MSTPDSFIDEVTEEVRRDRLYGLVRKYGWIGIALVLAIVGGASWNEWRIAQHDARAEVFGAGLAAALDQTGAARADAVAALAATGGQIALKQLFLADGLDGAASIVALKSLADDTSQAPMYRDLAVLRLVMLDDAMSLDARRTALQDISGRSFGILAREQLAYLLIAEGKTDEAIAALSALVQDQAAPSGLIARAQQAIISLGGTLPETSAG